MSAGLTLRPEWRELRAHCRKVKGIHLREMFAADPERAGKFTIRADGLELDYSKNRVTAKTMQLLVKLARSRGLGSEIERMFSGERINGSENRPVLHTALRNLGPEPVLIDGVDVMPQIRAERERMKLIGRRILSGEWLGCTGKPVRDVVHIGIGGSELGPRMAAAALEHYAAPGLRLHFVANVDPDALAAVLREVDGEKTLFIVASKTFTTLETSANAAAAKRWMLERFPGRDILSRHFLAVTAAVEEARRFGLGKESIFEMWEWVGGRFSLCSAVGLPVLLAVGEERFFEMLKGFHDMDRHFRSAPFERNLPVVVGLLGVWYRNFFRAATQAVLPYSHSLRHLPAYLQQLEMESNGKSVDREGRRLAYDTAPVLWGGSGTDSQHAFFQLLHQGTQMVPCDFIAFREPLGGMEEQHCLLLANFFGQTEALAFGRSRLELRAEKVPARLVPFKTFAGNRPSTSILASRLTPYTLGQLVALYEHKVFVQGVIWGVNSFDQFGVELGKELARKTALRMGAGG